MKEMIHKETELILIEGLLHSENSRPEFYKSIANKKGYSLKVFFNELYKAYERIETFVNTDEITSDIYIDEDGKEFKQKNVINLYQFTNGKFTGQIDNENVSELIPGLLPLAKQVYEQIAKDEIKNNLFLKEIRESIKTYKK